MESLPKLDTGEFCLIFRDMSNHPTYDISHMAEMFKALSNPNRLKRFLKLAECCVVKGGCVAGDGNGACVGDLSREVDVVASTVSHHIKELQRAGLIVCERRGQNILCFIDRSILDALARFFDRSTESKRSECC